MVGDIIGRGVTGVTPCYVMQYHVTSLGVEVSRHVAILMVKLDIVVLRCDVAVSRNVA